MDQGNYSQDPTVGKVTQVSDSVFKADKRMVKSLDAARTIYETLRTNNLARNLLMAEIDGLLGGAPPYNPRELQQAGLQHIANFNDLSPRAVAKRAALAYFNLLTNAEHMIRFGLRSLKGDPQAVEWAGILAANWDYAVKTQWPSFQINVCSMAWQLVKFGVSPVLFKDPRDPRWRVIELSRFYVPDQAQADLDMQTTVLVESELTIQYLWRVFEEVKGKKKETGPWNANELGRLLVEATAGTAREPIREGDYLDLQRKLYSGEWNMDNRFNDTIRMISLFQEEFDGKVSHYMFHRNYGKEDFVYFNPSQYDKLSQCLVLFTRDPGEYTIHANKGLGHETFSLGQAKIMLDCSLVDMGKWASTPIIKSSSLNSKDVEQIRFYPGVPTNIGSAEFVENNLGGNVQNVAAVGQYLSNLIQFNIAYGGGDPAEPDPDKGSLSPSQVKMMAFREFSVLKNQIMHFYSTFDRVLANMTGKMMVSKPGYPGYEIAECWKERCLDDGVPEEVFKVGKTDAWGVPKSLDVAATRVAGAGSQVAHLMGLEALQPIAGSFGAKGQSEYQRQLVMAAMGPEYIDAFLSDQEDVDEKTAGATVAGVENAIMQLGKSAVFSQDNEHRSHTATHLALGTEITQALVQKKMSPIDGDRIYNLLLPHTAEHLAAMEQNVFAQSDLAKMKPAYEEIKRYALLNRKNAVKMLQAQAEQEQVAQENQQKAMNEEELKNMQVMNEERRKDRKLEAQNRRQEKAGDAKEEMLRKRTEGELDIQRQRVEGELEIKKAEASGKQEIENKKANADISVKNKKAASPPPAPHMPSGEGMSAIEQIEKIAGQTPAPFDIEGTDLPPIETVEDWKTV